MVVTAVCLQSEKWKLNERQKCPSIFTPPAGAGSRSETVLDDRLGLSGRSHQ